jgi:hypothetical protein
MLFQAGYLTIKGFDPTFNTYTLDFPNDEVKQGLVSLLANEVDPRPVYKIGASFSSKTGTIDDWMTEH